MTVVAATRSERGHSVGRKMSYKEWTTERCYRQHTPPQIEDAKIPFTGKEIPHELPVVACGTCDKRFHPKHIANHRKVKHGG